MATSSVPSMAFALTAIVSFANCAAASAVAQLSCAPGSSLTDFDNDDTEIGHGTEHPAASASCGKSSKVTPSSLSRARQASSSGGIFAGRGGGMADCSSVFGLSGFDGRGEPD